MRANFSPVLQAPCYIVSDAHLGVASPQIERSFVSFLRGLVGEARSLVINGDLFDFWFEWKTVIPRKSFRALAALAELRDAGVEVLWVAGNHDCWGGEILREDVMISSAFKSTAIYVLRYRDVNRLRLLLTPAIPEIC